MKMGWTAGCWLGEGWMEVVSPLRASVAIAAPGSAEAWMVEGWTVGDAGWASCSCWWRTQAA